MGTDGILMECLPASSPCRCSQSHLPPPHVGVRSVQALEDSASLSVQTPSYEQAAGFELLNLLPDGFDGIEGPCETAHAIGGLLQVHVDALRPPSAADAHPFGVATGAGYARRLFSARYGALWSLGVFGQADDLVDECCGRGLDTRRAYAVRLSGGRQFDDV